MGLTYLQLIFDNPQRTYFSGETVSGRLVVKNDAPEELRSIIVEFKGMTSYKYSEEHTRTYYGDEEYFENQLKGMTRYKDSEGDTYHGYEEYFENYVRVFGGHGKTEVLESGEHRFKFSMILPNNLPSSFKCKFFHTSYTVKATLDRPWRFDREVKAYFTVLPYLDLTLDPKNKKSVKTENSKYFGCFFCKSGPLTLATHIPSIGYVPGQSIPITIEVDNASDVKVYEVACELLMIYTYYKDLETRSSYTVCAELRLEGVEEHNSKTWASKLTVPQLPPSSYPHCKSIDVNYILEVKAKPRGLHFALENSLPIIIGTVPVWQDNFFRKTPNISSPKQIMVTPSPPPSDTEEVLRPERPSHS